MRDIYSQLIDICLEEIRALSIDDHYDHLECIEKMVCHLKRNNSLGKALTTEKIDLLCLAAHAHKMCLRDIQNRAYAEYMTDSDKTDLKYA